MVRQLFTVAFVVLMVGSVALATAAKPKMDGKTKTLPKELSLELGKGVKLEMVYSASPKGE